MDQTSIDLVHKIVNDMLASFKVNIDQARFDDCLKNDFTMIMQSIACTMMTSIIHSWAMSVTDNPAMREQAFNDMMHHVIKKVTDVYFGNFNKGVH